MENKKSNVSVSKAAEVLEKPESQLKEMWASLILNKGAVSGLIIISFLTIVAVFGKLIMPYDPNYSDMTLSFLPPSTAHFFGTDQLGRDIFFQNYRRHAYIVNRWYLCGGHFAYDRHYFRCDRRLSRRQSRYRDYAFYGYDARHPVHPACDCIYGGARQGH